MRRILLVLLVACSAPSSRPKGTVETTRSAKVVRGDMIDRVLLTGSLHAASSIDLSTPRTDTWQLAIRWLAEDGTIVKAGDRLVEFDNSAFASKLEEKRLALLEAESTLKGAQDLAAMETAGKKTELDTAKIALDKAKLRADVPADLLTGRDAQERQLEKKRAEIAVKKAEDALAAQQQEAKLDIQVKQIELDKAKRAIEAAEKTIGELVLKAPRDGLVVVDDHPWEGRKFHVGDTVQPGMTIVSLPDLTQALEVNADLSDVDDGRVNVGMAGTCTLDAFPGEPLPCTVKELTPVARIKGQQSLRRAFAVTLTLDKPAHDRMRPGMSVKVELHRAPLTNVLLVPRGVQLPGVKLGACDAQRCVVESGLTEGQVVTIGGGA